MVQAAPLLNSFNSGEWSPDLDGRVDNSYYNASAAWVENFLSRVQGPLMKRPGLRFVNRTKYNNKKCRLIEFEFDGSTTQTYFLEFGDQYMRVFKDHGAVLETNKTISAITKANPGVVTANAHGYNNGDWVYIAGVAGMTEVNGKYYKVAGATTNTFQLTTVDGVNVNTSAYTTYTSGGTAARVYEIATQFTEDDLPNIRYTQSNDVMFFACKGKKPVTLSRSGHAAWAFADYDFQDGPYNSQNTTTTTLTPSATTGSVTITASTATFASTDVGRWVRIKHTSTWGCAKITAYTDATHVTASVHANFPFGATTAVTVWRLGFWTNTGSVWPQVVEFFQNRLWWFTSGQADSTYSSDYYSFSPTLTDGTVTDSNAIQRPMGARGVNIAQWAVDNEKALIVGTKSGEWLIRANTLGDTCTPTNCNASRATDFGTAAVQGLRVQNGAVFVQKTGRIICGTAYDLQSDGFTTTDLNLFNTRINDSGTKEFAYIAHPDNYLLCVNNDGSLSALTYNPSQQVRGWQRVSTAGTFISVASATAPEGNREEAWFVTYRDLNGSKFYLIEYMEDIFRSSTLQEDGFFVDCGLTYDGRRSPAATLGLALAAGGDSATLTTSSSAFVVGDVGKLLGTADGGLFEITAYTSGTQVDVEVLRTAGDNQDTLASEYIASDWWIYDTVTSVSGLDHLEGEEVTIVGDGAVLVPRTVAGGSVTLSEASSVVHIGLAYASTLKTSRMNAGSQDGTAQGKTKRIDKVVFRLWRTLGGSFGGAESRYQDDITYRKPQDAMDVQMPLFTGDTDLLDIPSDYGSAGQILFVHDQPLPCTMVAIMPRLVTQDGR